MIPMTFSSQTPSVMGILNITPDSFSDGGLFLATDAAITHAEEMVGKGASIIDIGGESTRPGYQKISASEECLRITPVIRELCGRAVLSVDSYKYEVAKCAIEAGCSILNDVNGLRDDEGENKAHLAAANDAYVVLMYNRRLINSGSDVIADARESLSRSVDIALAGGVAEDKIIIDPGIGFGTTREEDRRLTMELKDINPAGFPILYACSRKRFVKCFDFGEGKDPTWVLNMVAVEAGASLLRVHDPKPFGQYMDDFFNEGSGTEELIRAQEVIEWTRLS